MRERREARIRPPLVLALVSLVVILLWGSGAAAFCPRVKFVTLCDEWVEIGWTMGVDEGSIENFGGYRVWVRDVNYELDYRLAAEYVWGQDDPDSLGYWEFDPFSEDSVRVFIDSTFIDPLGILPDDLEPRNGRPYMYSVTAFEAGADTIASACREANSTGKTFTGPQIEYVDITDKGVDIGWNMKISEDAAGVMEWKFGGYRVWMREVWNEDDFHLAREYDRDVAGAGYDSTDQGYWPFRSYFQDPIRVYRSRALQNGFPYMFSVTTFRKFDDGSKTPVNTRCRARNSRALNDAPHYYYPREGTKTDLSRIYVIPNPYRAGADWELEGGRRVMFIGLPYPATIRIYTVSGGLVRTLTEDDGRDPGSDQQPWDLRNEDGEEIAPGVYIWDVEASGLGSATGKMMIIK